MKNLVLVLSICISHQIALGQVIDMHMHGYDSINFYGGQPHPFTGLSSPPTIEEHMKETVEMMDKCNIEYAVICQNMEAIEPYVKADSRFIPGYADAGNKLMPITQFEQYIKEGRIKVFGEIYAIYQGTTLADPKYEPYLKVCEQYQIPVAYHCGPALSVRSGPTRRADKTDPLLIEDVLKKFPELKVYLMHAGAPHFDNTVLMMMYYPNLYVDISPLNWIHPIGEMWVEDFLKKAKKGLLLDRVMWGSDQMVWPGSIKLSIDRLNDVKYLTDKEKRMILYDNARKFLGLDK